MFDLVRAGGFLMLPILACSVLALAIIMERLWMLRRPRVLPRNLVATIRQLATSGQLTPARVKAIRRSSPLGHVLAAGLANRSYPRELVKESIQEAGRHAAHDLERNLNTLGTIAAITPLLGLLGTVIGMIEVFSTITASGIGDPEVLAGGISQALITTAAGLAVAIPSLMFYRFFGSRVDSLVLGMEQEAIRLVEVLDGMRQSGPDVYGPEPT